MGIIGRTDGICNEVDCNNKAFKVNKIAFGIGVWECRKHYYEHR